MRIIPKSKNKIRSIFKKQRANGPKRNKDEIILNHIIQLKEYKECETLFTYVSVEGEIDTKKLISFALNDNKKVAVPKCISETEMEFYYIKSLKDLELGAYSLLEPKAELEKATEQNKGFMLVPALSADIFGYRVGYGGGYYDRFLKTFSGTTVVTCYENEVFFKSPKNKYDVRCCYLITDKTVRKTKRGKNYGK